MTLSQNQLLLMKVAKYISNFDIDPKIVFCASMKTPYYWSLPQDIILIYTLSQEGFDKIKDAKRELVLETFISGKQITESLLPNDDWLKLRRDLLIHEINELIKKKHLEMIQNIPPVQKLEWFLHENH